MGITAFTLNNAPVSNLSTAVQTMLGESAATGFDSPTPFAYRIPLDVFPALADPVTIRSAVSATLNTVILDPITQSFCTTTAWALLQFSGLSNEGQVMSNLPAPP